MFTTRRSGNTTKLIDYYVQLLFSEREITDVKDHHDTQVAHDYLFRKIVDRLAFEHPYVYSKADINYKRRFIRLLTK